MAVWYKWVVIVIFLRLVYEKKPVMELRRIVSNRPSSKHTDALAVAATVSLGLLGTAERLGGGAVAGQPFGSSKPTCRPRILKYKS